MKKLLILALIGLTPMMTYAEGLTATETDSMVAQLKSILDQYATRIKYLEVENAILREEVRKAGIQIPLSAYSGAILTTPTTTASTQTGTTTPATATVTATGTTTINVSTITTQFGERYAGFVTRIHAEWEGIKGAYKLPATAYIGGYEFVKQGDDNHAYVDIVFDKDNATAAYDAKILYEYNTSTFQRKLIGFFELDRTTGYYTTRSGSNKFPGVERTFVRDPLSASSVVPTTATTSGSTSSTTTATPATKVPTFAEIEQAYTDKRYLSVISLSNTYLTANAATYDLLRIRYRTYFIIGKYDESLAEIAKIGTMGQLSSSVACDAQVIATYSKDSALIAKYTAACKN